LRPPSGTFVVPPRQRGGPPRAYTLLQDGTPGRFFWRLRAVARDGCARVPGLQGQNEARRHAHRPKEHRPLPLRARRADRRCPSTAAHPTGDRRTGRAPSCAARRSGTPRSRKNIPGQTNTRRATCARATPMRPHWRALRRPGPALSTHERGVTTLAAPPLRFAAPLFLAERSGLFFLCAAINTRGDISARPPPFFLLT
jgi:hypothetical protein